MAKENKKSDKPKKTPTPKSVIYVEIDDEITTVFEKVKKNRSKEIFLSIPKRSILFQSLINIKILKRKLIELEKAVSFVTTDETGAYFAKQVGIKVYKNLKLEKFDPDAPEPSDATIDQVVRFTKERPKKRDQKKLSIADLRKNGGEYEFKGLISSAKDYFRNYKKNKQKRTLLVQTPHRQAILALIIGGIAMLMLIVYIALPHATIYVVPNKQVIEQAINVTLAEKEKNEGLLQKRPRRVLTAYAVQPGELTETITYKTAGKIFEGTNARGRLTVINEANRPWSFIPRTQFHTEDGLIFRAVDYVNVPARGNDGPSRTVIDVVADEFDTAGRPMGERGNVGPTRFKVANLAEASQQLVYGESEEPMVGGVTKTRTQVTEDDFNNALELAKQKLIDKTPALLQDYLDQQSELANNGLTLLDVFGSIKLEDPEAFADRGVIGTDVEEFTVTAKVKARGLAFSESEMLVILKNELLLRESPDKEISQIDNSGITYRIFHENEEAGIIEVTATIKGVETFDIDQNKQAGLNLIKKIKDHIIGMRVEDTIKYLENLPEIEKAKVKSWPFWAPSIPSLKDNVKIVVDTDV